MSSLISASALNGGMVKAIEAVREDVDYERESAILDQGLMEALPAEPDKWLQG